MGFFYSKIHVPRHLKLFHPPRGIAAQGVRFHSDLADADAAASGVSASNSAGDGDDPFNKVQIKDQHDEDQQSTPKLGTSLIATAGFGASSKSKSKKTTMKHNKRLQQKQACGPHFNNAATERAKVGRGPSFTFVCLGVGGGPLESDCSSYLLKPGDAGWLPNDGDDEQQESGGGEDSGEEEEEGEEEIQVDADGNQVKTAAGMKAEADAASLETGTCVLVEGGSFLGALAKVCSQPPSYGEQRRERRPRRALLRRSVRAGSSATTTSSSSGAAASGSSSTSSSRRNQSWLRDVQRGGDGVSEEQREDSATSSDEEYSRRGPAFTGLNFPFTDPALRAGHLGSLISGFLISHAHLDHVAGMVLGCASLPGKKKVWGLSGTLDNLRSVFDGKIWPKLASWEGEEEGFSVYRMTA